MYDNADELLNWALFKNDDWEAYTRLYNSHFKLLNNYGYKFTRDKDLIEDAVHDLFVNLWTNRATISNPASVKHYLYKSVRHILFRKLKQRSRFVDLEGDGYDFTFEVSFDNSYIEQEDKRLLQAKIKKVVQTLPARQQEIIYLRYYENIGYDEISEIMDINVSSAYKLLYKALSNLQDTLNVSKIVLIMAFLGDKKDFLYFDKFFLHLKG